MKRILAILIRVAIILAVIGAIGLGGFLLIQRKKPAHTGPCGECRDRHTDGSPHLPGRL